MNKLFYLILIALFCGISACSNNSYNDIFLETNVGEPEGPGVFSGDSGRIILIEDKKDKNETKQN